MTIHINTVQGSNLGVLTAFVRPESQISAPEAPISSVSALAALEQHQGLPVVRRALATGILAIGTLTAPGVGSVLAPTAVNLKIESVASGAPTSTRSAAEEYAYLRDEIVAAGIPLLSDEEIRQEIRERKGLKD